MLGSVIDAARVGKPYSGPGARAELSPGLLAGDGCHSPAAVSAQVEACVFRQMNRNEAQTDRWIETFRRSGFGIATVASGSMSPVLDIGDKAYVELSDPSRCRVGDIVIFPVDDSLMMHRIVGSLWTPHGKLIVHRGDNAGALAFGLVRQERILGRLIFVKKDYNVVLASSLPKPRAIGLSRLVYSLLALERCVRVWLRKVAIRLRAMGHKLLRVPLFS